VERCLALTSRSSRIACKGHISPTCVNKLRFLKGLSPMPLKQNPLSYISLDQGADFGFLWLASGHRKRIFGGFDRDNGYCKLQTENCKLDTEHWTLDVGRSSELTARRNRPIKYDKHNWLAAETDTTAVTTTAADLSALIQRAKRRCVDTRFLAVNRLKSLRPLDGQNEMQPTKPNNSPKQSGF